MPTSGGNHDSPDRLDELSLTRLPEGYLLASVAKYPELRKDSSTGLSYIYSIQLLNKETYDIPRGTGMTLDEALTRAIDNCGGDDGLSKAFRDQLQGSKH